MAAIYENFTDELKARSQAIHEKSDKLANLKLAIALTDTKLYSAVVYDFYCIFKAIEETIVEHSDNQQIRELWRPELARSAAFVEDLEYFRGLGWEGTVKTTKIVQDYVDHIRSIADEEPIILVAYIHTMYMAILSGGFILKRIVRNTLGLSGTDGLAIFQFPPDTNRTDLKYHLRTTINNMVFDRELKNRIIQEKISIFMRNNQIFSTIQPTVTSFKRITKLLLIFFLFIMVIVMAYNYL